MEEAKMREVARQLRKPDGEFGREMGLRMNEGNAAMNRDAIRALGIQPGDRILELGMGNGAFAPEICAAAPEVAYHGVDFSETMIEEARKRNAVLLENGTVAFTLGEAATLPYPKASFDAVLGVNIIYFWEQPQLELKSIREVLKPTGKLVLALRPSWCMDNLPFTAFGFRKYSTDSLQALLESGNFRVVQMDEHVTAEKNSFAQDMSLAHIICVAVSG